MAQAPCLFCWSGAERGVGMMKVKEEMRRAWRRLAGAEVQEPVAIQRKTMMLPSILAPYRAGTSLPKPTPANLLRFAETPLVRRSINVIQDQIASLDWQVRLKRGHTVASVEDAEERLRILRRVLEEPNPADSFRTLLEQVLEDTLVGGFGAIEMELTGNAERPVELWAVDGATIRIN